MADSSRPVLPTRFLATSLRISRFLFHQMAHHTLIWHLSLGTRCWFQILCVLCLLYQRSFYSSRQGADTIWRLSRKDDFTISGSIPQPTGSGPRHIALFGRLSAQTHPSDIKWLIFAAEDWLYTLHETTSTLSVQKISNDPRGESSVIDTVSITPPNAPAGAIFAAAEILIPCPSSQFPFPYIYVSNRNIGVLDPRGDTIAIFEHVNKGRRDERLRLVQQVYTGLAQIRGMEFGPAPQEYLIAGGANGSTGVAMLRRTEYGRNLEVVVRNLEIANRTSFVWLQ